MTNLSVRSGLAKRAIPVAPLPFLQLRPQADLFATQPACDKRLRGGSPAYRSNRRVRARSIRSAAFRRL
jgi:hypothetical protein